MATFNVKVRVDYEYEVEADDAGMADRMGWQYEDYSHHATVDSIEVEQLDDEEEEG
jgi:hypothetical protein